MRHPFTFSVGVALAVRIVAAQDVVSMSPGKFAAAVGERVDLTLRQSGQREAMAWVDDRIAWSLVRISGTQENSDRAPRAAQDAAVGTVQFSIPGAAVIGVDFKARTVQMDAASMQKALAATGRKAGAGEPKVPEGGGAVNVIQSVKTIVRVGASEPGQSSNVTSKTGQKVELRPTFDPTGIGIGSDIPVVVYAGDGKAPGAKLTAMHVPTGEKQEFIANDSAIGSFRLSRAGEWRIEFRHLVEAKEPKDGEPAWILYTATLTFEAPEVKEENK